jgi:hypothetical protein
MDRRDVLIIICGLLAFLLAVAIALGAQEDVKGQGKCQAEVHMTNPTGNAAASAKREKDPTAKDHNLQPLEQERARNDARAECSNGSTPSRLSSLQVFVAGIALAITVMGILLAHRTVVDERPTKRGRLLVSVPRLDRRMVRVANVGGSPAIVVGVGAAYATDAIPLDYWRGLEPVVRLVPVGLENAVEISANFLPKHRGVARFAVLIRYEDAYKDVWEAWRIFEVKALGTTIVEQDGERRSRN